MMLDIDSLIDAVIAREGGYANHPDDRGGATRFGITAAVARRHGYGGDMRVLPKAKAVSIYRRDYWDQPRFDAVARLAPRLAAELSDIAVNMGPATAIQFLQQLLNALNRRGRDYPDIARDGRIEPQTLTALDAYLKHRGAMAETVLLRGIDSLRGARYIHLAETRPANESFLYGWLANRLGQAAATSAG